jgi:tetratricopeptide (TPR) repeat protein
VKQTEPNKQIKRYVEFAVIIVMVLIYCGATYQRNLVWKNDFNLWSDAVKKSPDKERPYNNLGRAYLSNKAFLQAIPYLKEALRLNPYFSYAHYNLGIAYQGIGLYDKAITEYRKALYGTKQPYFADIHNNMGVCYFIKGWTDMAIEEFKQALNINPYFSDARFNLNIALQVTKKRAKGLDDYPSLSYCY